MFYAMLKTGTALKIRHSVCVRCPWKWLWRSFAKGGQLETSLQLTRFTAISLFLCQDYRGVYSRPLFGHKKSITSHLKKHSSPSHVYSVRNTCNVAHCLSGSSCGLLLVFRQWSRLRSTPGATRYFGHMEDSILLDSGERTISSRLCSKCSHPANSCPKSGVPYILKQFKNEDVRSSQLTKRFFVNLRSARRPAWMRNKSWIR